MSVQVLYSIVITFAGQEPRGVEGGGGTGDSHVCLLHRLTSGLGGARWLSGRVSDSGARGPGFETYLRRVVSLSKTLYSPKVLVNYPGSDGSVPT